MTFDTLLVPTDGSEPAETAARRGFDLAEALGAEVHVLSVADSSLATGAGYSGDSPSIRKRLRENATERSEALAETARARGLDTTAAIREGIPASEIVDYAAGEGTDMIALGTSGRGGVARAIVGSVADKVVRTASVPVVTMNAAAVEVTSPDSFESILVPTDGSEPATAAADSALALAEQLDATVHLFSVADPAIEGTLPSIFDDQAESASPLLEAAGDHLGAVADAASERGLEFITATTEGKPAAEILEYADREAVDLIAMGTAGRGGFQRALVGSVTDSVVRKASVPVVTFRPADD